MIPLSFISIAVSSIKKSSGAVAALVSCVVGVFVINLPLRSGILVASLFGFLVGLYMQRVAEK